MKSCPFCGARADLLGHPGDPADRSAASYSVSCAACMVETSKYRTKEEATAAWDVRSGLADASPLVAWIDLNSGTILHTESESRKPQIHAFSLRNDVPGQREYLRLCNWKLLRDYFRNPK